MVYFLYPSIQSPSLYFQAPPPPLLTTAPSPSWTPPPTRSAPTSRWPWLSPSRWPPSSSSPCSWSLPSVSGGRLRRSKSFPVSPLQHPPPRRPPHQDRSWKCRHLTCMWIPWRGARRGRPLMPPAWLRLSPPSRPLRPLDQGSRRPRRQEIGWALTSRTSRLEQVVELHQRRGPPGEASRIPPWPGGLATPMQKWERRTGAEVCPMKNHD